MTLQLEANKLFGNNVKRYKHSNKFYFHNITNHDMSLTYDIIE